MNTPIMVTIKEKKFFNAGWSHGKYFDYWSFVHFLTGVILGIGAIIVSAHNFLSFVLIIILLIIYEGLEKKVKVSENFENMLSDIIIGSAGSAVAIFLLPNIISSRDIFGVLGLSIIINLICVSKGWKNYLKRKAEQGSSYIYILYTLYYIYTLGAFIAITSLVYWLINLIYQ